MELLSSQYRLHTLKTTLHKNWPAAHRHVFAGKEPIQHYLDLPELTLLKKITFAM